MPKTWLYMLAVILPAVVGIVVLDTPFVDWLWYHEHVELYNFFNLLRVQPQFMQFMGGWPLPVFTATVLIYWSVDADSDSIPDQFLLLPLAYLPFSIMGGWLLKLQYNGEDLYTHPLIILPVGYVYILFWVAVVKLFSMLRLAL